MEGFDGHGAVEVDGEDGDALAAGEDAELVDQLLGATDGEGGDEDLFPVPDGVFDDGLELGEGLVEGSVVAVAVGRFEHDQVGVVEGRGVAHEGHAGRPDVAREDKGAEGGSGDGEFEAGRTEDVSGVDHAEFHAVGDLGDGAVFDGAEQRQDLFGVGGGVERGDVVAAGAEASAEEPGGVFFLDLGGVAEEDGGQFGGGTRAPDRPAEAGTRQQGQSPDVVEMGMGEDDGVEPSRLEAGRQSAVAALGERGALVQAEVDEDAGAAGFDERG